MIDARSNAEKIEEQRNEILEKMAKLTPGTPEYKLCLDQLKILSDINGGYEERENTRLSNNQKNETEYDSKVRLEAEKIKTEHLKLTVKVLEDACYVVIGTLVGPFVMYNLDELKQGFKPMTKMIGDIQNKITQWRL